MQAERAARFEATIAKLKEAALEIDGFIVEAENARDGFEDHTEEFDKMVGIIESLNQDYSDTVDTIESLEDIVADED